MTIKQKLFSKRVVVIISGLLIIVVSFMLWKNQAYNKEKDNENVKQVNSEVIVTEKEELTNFVNAIVFDGYKYFDSSDKIINLNDISEEGKITIAAKFNYLNDLLKINTTTSEKKDNRYITNNDIAKIVKTARVLFNDKTINFKDFTIIVDKENCGLETFSSLYGKNLTTCNTKQPIVDFKEFNHIDNDYIVEAYVVFAEEKTNKVINFNKGNCKSKQSTWEYNNKLTIYKYSNFTEKLQEEDIIGCCFSLSCESAAIAAEKDDIKKLAKEKKSLYTFTFNVSGDDYVIKSIEVK